MQLSKCKWYVESSQKKPMFACPTLSLGGEDPNSVQRKRLQRVEILKIAEPCPLIDPSQVVVTQGEILVADPVLTPIGKNPSYLSCCGFGFCMFSLFYIISLQISFDLSFTFKFDFVFSFGRR